METRILKVNFNALQLHKRKNLMPLRHDLNASNIFRYYKNFNGIFTNEDVKQIEIIKAKFKDLTPDAIRKNLLEIGKQIQKMFGNNSDKSTNRGRKFYKQLLKIKYLQAALSWLDKQEIKIYPTSHIMCLDNFCTDPRERKTSEKFVIHPIETASKILGSYNAETTCNCKFIKNNNIQDLIKLKMQILARINKYNHQNAFSDSEKNKLKILVNDFVMIDNSLKKNNICTDNIERYMFNEINFEKANIGEKLSDAEIIVNKGSIYNHKLKQDVSTMTTFAKTNNNFQLKIYHILSSKELNSENIKGKLDYLLRVGNIDGINALNKKIEIIENAQQEKIAQINLIFVNKEMLKARMQPNTLENIDDVKKAVLIEDFENYNQQAYSNTSLKFKNSLRDILLKNEVGRIFLKARSFNDTNHSPAALYLRLGFTPIFQSKEFLLEELFSKKRIQENDGIWFEYLVQKN